MNEDHTNPVADNRTTKPTTGTSNANNRNKKQDDGFFTTSIDAVSNIASDVADVAGDVVGGLAEAIGSILD